MTENDQVLLSELIKHASDDVLDHLIAGHMRLSKEEQADLLYHSGVAAHEWNRFAKAFNSRLSIREKHSRAGGILNTYTTLSNWCGAECHL